MYSDTRASLFNVSTITFLQRGRLSEILFTKPLFPDFRIVLRI